MGARPRRTSVPARPPFEWPALLRHLEGRAVTGLERVRDGRYRRAVREGRALASVEVAPSPDGVDLLVRGDVDLAALQRRAARVFDVHADTGAIAAHLARDPLLAPLVAARPGLRIPGAWDPFELAVRAVLGQQVSVEAARRLAGRLLALCGEPLPAALAGDGVEHAFPTPERLAAADLAPLPMPGARKAALLALARAAADDPGLLAGGAGLDATVARLRAVRGIGDWTAQYIALRGLGERDAFPASDVGLLRGLAGAGGVRPRASELLQRAERWRPWRAYAAQHLWAEDSARVDIGRGD